MTCAAGAHGSRAVCGEWALAVDLQYKETVMVKRILQVASVVATVALAAPAVAGGQAIPRTSSGGSSSGGGSSSSGGGAGTVLGALRGMTIVLSSPSCPCCMRPVACSSKPCLTSKA